MGRMKKLRSPLGEPVWVSAVSSVEILGAPEVHSVAQPQDRPVLLAASHGQAHARTPLVAQAGQLFGQQQLRIASAAIGGGNCSRSQRNPAETTSSLPVCHCAVAYPAQSLVLRRQSVGPMVCE